MKKLSAIVMLMSVLLSVFAFPAFANDAEEIAKEYCDKGVEYLDAGEYDKAIAAFNRALAVMPKYEEAYSQRGFAYLQAGEYDKAISDYSRAIAIKELSINNLCIWLV